MRSLTPKTKSAKTQRGARGVMVLIIASLVAKIIGAIYRVPLTNVLGAEGMGMYQLVFPVYAFFLVLSSAGIPSAISRIVAEKRAVGANAKKYLAFSLLMLSLFSAAAAIGVAGLSKTVAELQGNGATWSGFVAVAPAILFVGGISGLRGWFQGNLDMVPTAVSNIVEQTVKLGAGLGLAIALTPKGALFGVLGALGGVVASEIVAFGYLLVTYFAKERTAPREMLKTDSSERKELARVALPIALVALLMPLGSLIDSVVIVNMLKLGGHATPTATALYGLLTGPVASLINVPIVVTMSLATLALPSVSAARAELNVQKVLSKSRTTLKVAYFLGICSALFVACFARPLINLLYPTLPLAYANTAINLLLIESVGIAATGVMQIYVALLQAVDRTKYAIGALLAALAIRVVLSLVLTRYVGIEGAAASSVAFAVTALGATLVAFNRMTDIKLVKSVAKTLVVGVIMALAVLGVRALVPNAIGGIVVGFAFALLVIAALGLLFKVFERNELMALPMGTKIVLVADKLGLTKTEEERENE